MNTTQLLLLGKAPTQTVQPLAIPSAEAVSVVVVLPQAVTVIPTGVPSAEAVSPVVIAPGPITTVQPGIPTAEAVDPVTVLPQAVTVQPVGVPSSEAVSPVVVAPGSVSVTPIPIVTNGAFRIPTYYTEFYGDVQIPVDSTKKYYESGEWRGDPGVGQKHYFGFMCFDEDHNFIDCHMVHTVRNDSLTTLAADLHPGDMVVHLTDASLWWHPAAPDYYHGIGLWPYFTALGTRFDRADGYTRHAHYNKYVDITGNDLNLIAPWDIPNPNDPGGVWPAGTEVANMRSGGTYNYSLAANDVIGDNAWHSAQAILKPPIVLDPDDNPDHFRAGTKYVKVMILANREVPGGATIYRNIELRKLEDPTHNLIVNGEGELGDLTNFSTFVQYVPNEDFGTPNIYSYMPVTMVGIPSQEAVNPVVVLPQAVTVTPLAIPSAEAVGLPTILPGPISFSLFGIPTAEAFGNTFARAYINVIPTGIPSAEGVGPVVITVGTVRITPTGIPSAEMLGNMVIVPPGAIFAKFGTKLKELVLMFTPQLEVLGQPFTNGGIIVAGSGGLEVTSGLKDGGLVVLTVFDLIDSGALVDA